MAETRSTTNNEKIAALTAKFDEHDQTLIEMKQQLSLIAQFIQNVDQRLSDTKVQVQEENQNMETSIVVPGAKLLKLEFPHFLRVDSSSWIYKSNRFFAYYNTPEH